MKQRNNHMFCCGCGYAVAEKNIFKKAYRHTAICLCKKCAKGLEKEIKDWSENK